MGVRENLKTILARRTSPSISIPLPQFEGRPDEDIDAFLDELTSLAVQRGTLLDYRWRTDIIAKCLHGEAHSWYKTLDEVTRRDWIELQDALRRQYLKGGPRDQSMTVPTTPAIPPSPILSSPSTKASNGFHDYSPVSAHHREFRPSGDYAVIPIPALAPPSSFPTRKSFDDVPSAYSESTSGRIRVIFDGASTLMYISKSVSPWSWHVMTSQADDALEVEWNQDTSDCLKMMNASTLLPYLGLRWEDDPKDPTLFAHSAYLTGQPSKKPNLTPSNLTILKGPRASDIWSLDDRAGNMRVLWTDPTSLTSTELTVVAETTGTNGLRLVSDVCTWMDAQDPRLCFVEAKLRLETIAS